MNAVRITQRAVALLALAGAASVLPGCQAPAPTGLQGDLYFASGRHVGRFSLRDASSSVAAHLGDVNVEFVSVLPAGQVLVSVEGPINDRLVTRVLRWDPRTDERRALFAGRRAQFVPGAGHIVFERDGNLYAIGYGDNVTPQTLIHERLRGAAIPVVVLTQDRVLYAIDTDTGMQIRLRDLQRGDDRSLPALSRRCDLASAVWVDTASALVCRRADAGGGAFALVSLSGAVVAPLPVPDGQAAHPLVYLRDGHAVLFAIARPAWRSRRGRTEVWALDLDGGQPQRLSKKQFLGNSVAYVP